MLATKTSADLLGTFTSTGSDANTLRDNVFDIGANNAGQINSFIDEFRISSIARTADGMMFGAAAAPTPEPSTAVLALLGLAGVAGSSRRRRRNRA